MRDGTEEMAQANDRLLVILRLLNNIVIAWTCAASLRILFLPDSGIFVLEDLVVVMYTVCATLIGHVRPRFLTCVAAFGGMLGAVWYLAMQTALLPGMLRFVVCVLITVCTVYSRITEQALFVPAFVESVLFLAIHSVSFAIDRPAMRPVALLGMILFAGMCVLYEGQANMLRALSGFHHRAAVPYARIRRTTGGLMAGCIGGTLLFALLAGSLDDGGRFWRWLKDLLLRLLRALFSLLPGEAAQEPEIVAPAEAESMAGPMMLPEPEETNPLWVALWDALFTVLAIVVFAALAVVAIHGIREFLRRFRETRGYHATGRGYLRPGEKSEHVSLHHGRGGGNGPGLRLTPDATIRRLYIRAIRHQPNASGIRASHTPLELEQAAVDARAMSPLLATAEQPEGAAVTEPFPKEMRLLYEKARYAPERCTSADVKQFRNMIRSLR
ncbi:MAG: hypothetical protein IJT34_08020 [Butyrivibrio sp.]|nr:hypothetical protein [Butyrivibrio sp.]